MPIYNEIWAGPGKNYKKVNGSPQLTFKWYIVIHNTSNDASAAGEADYAKRRTDGVGAHYFCDEQEILQSTDTDRCVGHVGSDEGNTRGLSYEITGFNGWTRDQWLANVAWDDLASAIARDCIYYGIPVKLLTIDEMRKYSANVKGFATHDMCRIAWGETTHTDPGPNFPMDYLLDLVASHIGGVVVNAEDVIEIWQSHLAPKGPTGSTYNMQDHLLTAEAEAYAANKGVQAILARPPVTSAPIDQAALDAAVEKAILKPNVLAAIAKAVTDEIGS